MRLVFAGLSSISALLFLTSCGEGQPAAGGPGLYKNEWIVTGKVTDKNFANGRVMAIGMDGTRFLSKINKDNTFGIELPGNNTLALYFLSAQEAQNPGVRNASMLTFEESSDVGMTESLRLPDVMFDRNLSLGEIDIKGDKAFCTVNPASTLDFDMDGVVDGKDTDDQNDGLNDLDQRKSLEHVNICHFTSESSGETKTVPISQIFTHVDHGDTIGPCRYLTPRPGNTENAPMPPKAPVPAVIPGPAPQVNPKVTIEETPKEDEAGVPEEEMKARAPKKGEKTDEDKEQEEDKPAKEEGDKKPKKDKKDKK